MSYPGPRGAPRVLAGMSAKRPCHLSARRGGWASARSRLGQAGADAQWRGLRGRDPGDHPAHRQRSRHRSADGDRTPRDQRLRQIRRIANGRPATSIVQDVAALQCFPRVPHVQVATIPPLPERVSGMVAGAFQCLGLPSGLVPGKRTSRLRGQQGGVLSIATWVGAWVKAAEREFYQLIQSIKLSLSCLYPRTHPRRNRRRRLPAGPAAAGALARYKAAWGGQGIETHQQPCRETRSDNGVLVAVFPRGTRGKHCSATQHPSESTWLAWSHLLSSYLSESLISRCSIAIGGSMSRPLTTCRMITRISPSPLLATVRLRRLAPTAIEQMPGRRDARCRWHGLLADDPGEHPGLLGRRQASYLRYSSSAKLMLRTAPAGCRRYPAPCPS